MKVTYFITSRRLFLALGCFGVALAGHAETWILANGDRVTGELIKADAQYIELQHASMGRLKLPRAALRAPAAAGVDPAEHQTVAAQATAAESKPAVKKEEVPKWKRQVEVGFSQQSGSKEKQDLTIRGQLEGKEGLNTYRATGRWLRSEAAGKIVTDRRDGDFRWRHDINKRWFAQSLTNYEEDDVRKIDLNLEQQLGGGYRVIDSERHKASVGLGAAMQYLQRQDTNEQTAMLGTFFQDYSYQLNTRLKLVQESSFMISNRGTLNLKSGIANSTTDPSYRLKFNTGVQSKVTDHMSLNVRLEYDYDRSVLNTDLRFDQRLTTSLGYLW